MLKFEIYRGKSIILDKKKEKLSVSVVKNLIKNYVNNNHVVITDSFFSGKDISNFMSENGFIYIGMMNKNRLQVSKKIKNNKLQQGQCEFNENESMIFTKYQDKRQMTVIKYMKNNDIVLGQTYNKKKKKYQEIEKPFLLEQYS